MRRVGVGWRARVARCSGRAPARRVGRPRAAAEPARSADLHLGADRLRDSAVDERQRLAHQEPGCRQQRRHRARLRAAGALMCLGCGHVRPLGVPVMAMQRDAVQAGSRDWRHQGTHQHLALPDRGDQVGLPPVGVADREQSRRLIVTEVDEQGRSSPPYRAGLGARRRADDRGRDRLGPGSAGVVRAQRAARPLVPAHRPGQIGMDMPDARLRERDRHTGREPPATGHHHPSRSPAAQRVGRGSRRGRGVGVCAVGQSEGIAGEGSGVARCPVWREDWMAPREVMASLLLGGACAVGQLWRGGRMAAWG
jgi:hypothetical protein